MTEDPMSAEGQAQRLEAARSEAAAIVRRPDVAQRLRAAGPEEWSALQILGHMAELATYWPAEIGALAQTTGATAGFGRSPDAPERLAAVQHGAVTDPEVLLSELDTAVASAASRIRAMTPEQRERVGRHQRLGEMSVAQALNKLVVSHFEEHVTQMKQVLGAG
jgi:hypothetical protein